MGEHYMKSKISDEDIKNYIFYVSYFLFYMS